MQVGPQPLHYLQIFDDASRGPWGSTMMLFRVSLGSILAWGFALVTVAGMGIEPSAQNILDIQLQAIPLTNLTAEISIAKRWYSKAFVQSDGNFSNLGMAIGLPHLQGAVLNGLSGQVLLPSFVCPSPAASCKWEPFKSLGVCADFRNVTEGVTRNCTGDGPARSCKYENITGWLEIDTKARPTNDDSEGYIPTLEYRDPGDSSGFSHQTQTLYSGYGQSGGPLYGPWLIIRHDSTKWAHSNWVAGLPGTPPFQQLSTATLSYCEKTYTNIRTADPVSKGQLASQLSVTSQPLYNRQVYNTGLPSLMDIGYSTSDNASSYNITRASEDGLRKYLISALRRSAFRHIGSSAQATGYTHDSAMNVDFLLQTADNLGLIAHDLAETLTNLIRNNNSGGDNNAAITASGTAFRIEQFVIIRWEWLILPVMETFLAALLLVICIVQSSMGITITTNGDGDGASGGQMETQTQPLLKDSVVAYMTYPLGGWAEEEMAVRGKQTVEKLGGLAKGMRARFAVDEGERWRFWKSRRG